MLSQLSLICVCIGIGALLRASGRVPDTLAPALNAYVIHVAFPAMALLQIPRMQFSAALIWPAVMPWLLVLFSAAVVWQCAKVFRWSRSTLGAMLIVVPLGNTSFLGFPLVTAFWTEAGLPYAIIYDQIGSFLALTAYGISVIAHFGAQEDAQQLSAAYVLKRIVQFPPFLALLLGLILRFTGTPDLALPILNRLADTLVPVILIAVGLQWRLQLAREDRGPLAIGLTLKLLVMPAFAYGLLSLAGVGGLLRNITVFESGMSSMITAAVMAMGAGLAPRLCAAMIGFGLPLSLLTLWGWYWLLR